MYRVLGSVMDRSVGNPSGAPAGGPQTRAASPPAPRAVKGVMLPCPFQAWGAPLAARLPLPACEYTLLPKAPGAEWLTGGLAEGAPRVGSEGG